MGGGGGWDLNADKLRDKQWWAGIVENWTWIQHGIIALLESEKSGFFLQSFVETTYNCKSYVAAALESILSLGSVVKIGFCLRDFCLKNEQQRRFKE